MSIRFALIAEGGTERPLVDILTTLCSRVTSDEVVGLWGNEVLAMFDISKDVEAQLEQLIACDTGLDLVFVHRDADGVDDTDRRQTIESAAKSVDGCPRTIAVVPIQETEAWLLTSEDAIRRAAGNPRGRAPLELPKIKHIERRASPKELLRGALVLAAKPGRRQHEIRSNNKVFRKLRRQLLEQLDLDGDVTQLSAWQRLVSDIEHAFAKHP